MELLCEDSHSATANTNKFLVNICSETIFVMDIFFGKKWQQNISNNVVAFTSLRKLAQKFWIFWYLLQQKDVTFSFVQVVKVYKKHIMHCLC